jgi:probable rRNA maturation factor
MPHDVSLTIDEPFESHVDSAWLLSLAQRLLELLPSPGNLDILVTGDEVVAELNAEYLDEEGTTDVLSFPAQDYDAEEDDFVWPEGVAAPLGEVVLCVPQAERQAAALGHSLQAEVGHLLVHGVLHLLGYDHLEPDEEREMRALEDEYLARLLPDSHPVHG